MKKLICALLALILMLGAFALCETQEAEEEAPIPAPDFVFETLEGEEIHFSDLVGKPLLLNIWATWCPPCREELPSFQKAYDKYAEEITFVFVSVDDGKEEVEEFLTENGYTFPVYLDSGSNCLITYGISSIPVTVLVDAEGNILAGQIGALSEDLVGLCIAILLGDVEV